MPEWGTYEYALDGIFYCPWTEWHPEDKKKCYAGLPSDRDRYKHLRQHVKPVVCPYTGCPMKVAEQRDMRKHVETHKPRESRLPFPCPDCGKNLTRGDNTSRHRKKAHGVKAHV
ncbi:hypothetical protein F5883DRAFT_171715 [Diaporthe sp. PMI_573]|nr:hypothetical protein F5883DRAFT_171715 [Diaporthaceae sp. PMI_573]